MQKLVDDHAVLDAKARSFEKGGLRHGTNGEDDASTCDVLAGERFDLGHAPGSVKGPDPVLDASVNR